MKKRTPRSCLKEEWSKTFFIGHKEIFTKWLEYLQRTHSAGMFSKVRQKWSKNKCA